VSPVRGTSHAFLRKALVSVAFPKQSSPAFCGPLNWDEIATIADHHSISGSIYPFVRDHPHAPLEVIGKFRERSIQAIAQAELAWEVLSDLKDLLTTDGPCVILQGLSLLETVYPAHTARFLGDVDLYLPRANWQTVRSGLYERGFRPWLHYANVWKRDGLTLDLHAGLWGEERIPQRMLIAPGSPVDFCPSARCPGFSLLPAEWMLVHSIYHTAKHGFAKLLWDLDLLLLRSALDLVLMLPASASRLIKLARGRIEMLCAPESSQRLGFGAIRNRALLQVMKGNGHPALGEIALSMLAPTWPQTFRYLAGAAVPGKQTLAEMYGTRSVPALLARRIGSFLGMSW